MKTKSKSFSAEGLQAESPLLPGLTRKEAWDKLIARRQPVSKEEILQRIQQVGKK
jgi:hypothetical protein